MASTLKNYSVEVHFAQRLAASEKKIRDKAVKRLRSWITVRSQSEKNDFSEDDLMKIWKGLFYCVWMSDKLLIQQALVENIATLVYSFKSQKSVMLYIRTFYKTMMREWLGIDHLRIDKYYKLVRKMLNHSFEMIKKSEWKPEVIDEFVDVMKTTVLTSDPDVTVPDGLRFHMADIYLVELCKVGGNQLSPEETLKFLDPFCVLAAKTSKAALLRVILNEIFRNGIIRQSDITMAEKEDRGEMKADNNEDDDDADEEQMEQDEEKQDSSKEKTRKAKLKFDYGAIADRIFALSSEPSVLGKNRKRLYQMVQKFKDLDKGIFPVDKIDLKVADVIIEEEKRLKQIEKKKKALRKKKWRENVKARKRKNSEDLGDDVSESGKTQKEGSSVKKIKVNGHVNHDVKEKGSQENSKKKHGKQQKQSKVIQEIKKDGEKENRNKLGKETLTFESETKKVKVELNATSVEKISPVKSEKTEDTSIQTKPFAEFEKVSTPLAFVRRNLRKRGQVMTEAENGSEKKKKVEFALSKVFAQDPKAYKESVRKSPSIPYDGSKKPTQSALKTPPLKMPRMKTRSASKKAKSSALS